MKRASSAGSVKKAVLLVGSGYGALKVAQDLAQSGHSLVWVTKAPHFLELPGGREPVSRSGPKTSTSSSGPCTCGSPATRW